LTCPRFCYPFFPLSGFSSFRVSGRARAVGSSPGVFVSVVFFYPPPHLRFCAAFFPPKGRGLFPARRMPAPSSLHRDDFFCISPLSSFPLGPLPFQPVPWSDIPVSKIGNCFSPSRFPPFFSRTSVIRLAADGVGSGLVVPQFLSKGGFVTFFEFETHVHHHRRQAFWMAPLRLQFLLGFLFFAW